MVARLRQLHFFAPIAWSFGGCHSSHECHSLARNWSLRERWLPLECILQHWQPAPEEGASKLREVHSTFSVSQVHVALMAPAIVSGSLSRETGAHPAISHMYESTTCTAGGQHVINTWWHGRLPETAPLFCSQRLELWRLP